MNIYNIPTPFNIDIKLSLASFKFRLLAWLIDFLVVYAYNLIVVLFVFSQLQNLGIRDVVTGDAQQILVIVFIMIPSTFYHLISQLIFNGRSLGKYVCNLRVVDIHQGGAASVTQIILRNLLCIVNYFLGFLMFAIVPISLLGFLLLFTIISIPDIISVAANTKNQKLGDLLAGTIVVHTKKTAEISQTIFQTVDENLSYNFQYPTVHLLTDNEINGLYNVIRNRKKFNDAYFNKLAQRIESKLNITNNQYDEIAFFEKLIEEYNYYHQKK